MNVHRPQMAGKQREIGLFAVSHGLLRSTDAARETEA